MFAALAVIAISTLATVAAIRGIARERRDSRRFDAEFRLNDILFRDQIARIRSTYSR